MEQKNIFIIIVIATLTALLVGGGIYWWQQSIRERERNMLQQQVSELEEQKNQAITEKNELQQQIEETTQERDELQQQIYELTKEPERYVKIISPNGGESLCLGEDYVIEWESKGLNSISLRIRKGGITWPLDTLPATFNETGELGKGMYVWKVGTASSGRVTLQEGFAYEIIISSVNVPSAISDTSDGVFSLLLCKG